MQRLGLSARTSAHIAQAVQYRALDRGCSTEIGTGSNQ